MVNEGNSSSKNDAIAYSNALECLEYFKGLYLTGRESNDPLIKEIVSKNWDFELFDGEGQIPSFFYHIIIKGYIPLKNAEAAAAVNYSSNQALLNLYNRNKNSDGLGMVTYVNPERKGNGSRSSFVYSLEALFRLYMYTFLHYQKGYEHDTIFEKIGYAPMQTNSAIDAKSFVKKDTAEPIQKVDPVIAEMASLKKDINLLTGSLVRLAHETNANKKYIARSSSLIGDLNMKLHSELEAKMAANNVSISELTFKMNSSMDERNKLDKELKEREIYEIRTRENIEKLKAEITELMLEQESNSPKVITENSTTVPKENTNGGFFKKLFGGTTKETVIEKVIEKKDNTALIESLNNQIKLLNDILMESKNVETLKRDIELQYQIGRSLVAQVDNLVAEQTRLSEEKAELIKQIYEHQQLALEQPTSDELSPEFDSIINNLKAIGMAEFEDYTGNENEQQPISMKLNNGRPKIMDYIDVSTEE